MYLPFILSLSSCQINKKNFPAWGSIGDIGFAMNINQLAGDHAVDCGFFDLKSKAETSNYAEGYHCAEGAYKQGLPFKLGTLTVPIDSYFYQAHLESADGKYLEVNFDIYPDMNANHHILWTRSCEKFQFNTTQKQIIGVNCEKVSEYSW
ncbi:MAG: hypothetical protein R3E90_12710 [Marinicella sp.]|nr:hypothetical protein [Xanthomonadales bacterium]